MLLAVLLAPTPAAAAPGLADVGAFDAPVHVTAPPGDPPDLFVVEQAGRVRLVHDGAVRAEPFLDLRARVGPHDYEQGLLSIAFPSDYSASGRFYVMYTAGGEARASPRPPSRCPPDVPGRSRCG